MSEEYFKTILAIYIYGLTGVVPKENLLVNIIQNINKQTGVSNA